MKLIKSDTLIFIENTDIAVATGLFGSGEDTTQYNIDNSEGNRIAQGTIRVMFDAAVELNALILEVYLIPQAEVVFLMKPDSVAAAEVPSGFLKGVVLANAAAVLQPNCALPPLHLTSHGMLFALRNVSGKTLTYWNMYMNLYR